MCVGLLGGLALMLTRPALLADSGAQPSNASFYTFWVPVGAIAGAVFGFALGLIYAVLMVATRPLRARIGHASWSVRNLPRLTCGFVAGAITGAWAGAESSAMFGIVGLVSASLSRFDRPPA